MHSARRGRKHRARLNGRHMRPDRGSAVVRPKHPVHHSRQLGGQAHDEADAEERRRADRAIRRERDGADGRGREGAADGVHGAARGIRGGGRDAARHADHGRLHVRGSGVARRPRPRGAHPLVGAGRRSGVAQFRSSDGRSLPHVLMFFFVHDTAVTVSRSVDSS